MNVCRNCGFEFDGNFCPQCGTGAGALDSPDITPPLYDDGAGDLTLSASDGGWLSMEAKEKNILGHVGKLLEFGGFIEAERVLKDLEKEELSRVGSATAAVYYYKILTRYRVSSDDELVRKLAELKLSLKSDIDFRMSQVSPDGEYKERIARIEERVARIDKIAADTLAESKRLDYERNRATEAEELRRSTVRLSGWNVFFAIVGMVFLIIEIGSSSRALKAFSFVLAMILSFVSVFLSVYLIRTRGSAGDNLKGLNAVMLTLSLLVLVLCIVFAAI